jgi:hypothetical protein
MNPMTPVPGPVSLKTSSVLLLLPPAGGAGGLPRKTAPAGATCSKSAPNATPRRTNTRNPRRNIQPTSSTSSSPSTLRRPLRRSSPISGEARASRVARLIHTALQNVRHESTGGPPTQGSPARRHGQIRQLVANAVATIRSSHGNCLPSRRHRSPRAAIPRSPRRPARTRRTSLSSGKASWCVLGGLGGITRNGDASAPAMVIACPLGHGRKPVAASIPLRGPAEWSTRKQLRGVPT